MYSDKVDLIESIVFPLFNIAVECFNADIVTGLPVFTSIGYIMRFGALATYIAKGFAIENPSNKLTLHGNITYFTH